MDKYSVKLYSHAVRDLEEIYAYIARTLKEPEIADELLTALEDAICSLEHFPERGSYRKTGVYAGKKYRQLIIRNFLIVYKIDTKTKTVMVVTVRNQLRDF